MAILSVDTVFRMPLGLGPRFQFLIHGVHHIYPSDPLRLVMPPLLSRICCWRSPSSACCSAACSAGRCWWNYRRVCDYDCVHFWTHHGQPKSKLGHLVRRLHMLHHFRDATKGFGVHAIWWDYAVRHGVSARRYAGHEGGLSTMIRQDNVPLLRTKVGELPLTNKACVGILLYTFVLKPIRSKSP